MPGPGAALFDGARARRSGELPIIAEDLGVITPDVDALRDSFGFPGMKVLQFAFGGDGSATASCRTTTCRDTRRLHRHARQRHDARLVGDRAASAERAPLRGATSATDGSDIAWDLIRLRLRSVGRHRDRPAAGRARPGQRARMNLPGTAGGNWGWRFDWSDVRPDHARACSR